MVNNKKLWYLQRINFYKELPKEELEKFVREVKSVSYKKGQSIYLPGDLGENIYMVKEGFVKLSQLSEKGKSFTLTILDSGQIFGELEAFGSETRSTLASAHSDCMLCVHSKNSLIQLVNDNPQLVLNLAVLINKGTQNFKNKLSNLVFKSVPEKLICLLHDLSKDHGVTVPEGLKIDVPLTHQDLADLLGIVRQTLTEALNSLRDEGHLTSQGKYIIIKSPDFFTEMKLI